MTAASMIEDRAVASSQDVAIDYLTKVCLERERHQNRYCRHDDVIMSLSPVLVGDLEILAVRDSMAGRLM